MKTIKIKLSITPSQSQLVESYFSELSWIWNKVLASELNNHATQWYKWAAKQSGKGWPAFSLDGADMTPLRFGKSAFIGAACQIAIGGAYWKRDDSINVAIKVKGKTEFRKGGKWMKGDRPYTPVPITDYQPRTFTDGTPLLKPADWDRVGKLNQLREADGLPPLSLPSDYIGGLVAHFDTAWKAWLDPKLKSRGKLKFKNPREGFVESLSNPQKPPSIDFENETIRIPGIGAIAVGDRSWRDRIPSGGVPRTYTVNSKPSGWYINIVFANALQPSLKKMEKAAAAVKSQYGKESPEYLEARASVSAIASQISEAGFVDRKPLSIGIDPGVNAIIGTDHGALFRPNLARERASVRVEYLSAKLATVKELNDKQWKDAGSKRSDTKNEIKLKYQIARTHEKGANSSNAFNHKLSTRLVGTYTAIAWEDTQLTNLLKQATPKASEEGVGYEKNGAASKRGLNWSLRQRCLGDLKAKTKQKMGVLGGEFIDSPAPYSSRECSCCGAVGDRTEQHEFICKNELCEAYLIPKQADVNAARNHAKNAGFSISDVIHSADKLIYSRPTRRRKKVILLADNRSLGGIDRKVLTRKAQVPGVKEKATTLIDAPELWGTMPKKA